MMVKVNDEPVDIVLIQVYMPTTKYEDWDVEQIYEQIKDIIRRQRGDANVIVMGDFNARVGEGSDGKVIGKYGLEKRNDRGQMLSDFCKKNSLVITNTLFEQEKRRRYTWTAPPRKKRDATSTTSIDEEDKEDEEERDEEERNEADKNGRRYQIDYILVKQRYRNGVKCCKSYPGADIGSDHKLVAMKMLVKLKKLRKPRRKRKWDVEFLKRNSIPFQKKVEDTIKPNSGRNVNERWTNLKERF